MLRKCKTRKEEDNSASFQLRLHHRYIHIWTASAPNFTNYETIFKQALTEFNGTVFTSNLNVDDHIRMDQVVNAR